ncbi:hypothetical protein [Sphingobacterium sp. UBA5980]|uniref:hypothetical protein n=1 Tax=Sphingobacterium sp. UBA5980 TaxID=1947504 RepID=UPI00257AA81C|nr:hypothetical protein [Sphingobacterium sp. UBA5980]
MNKIVKLISVATIAKVGKEYPVLVGGHSIGTAIFLNKNEKEEFIFETSYNNSEDYEHMFDVDTESNELTGIRAKISVDE